MGTKRNYGQYIRQGIKAYKTAKKLHGRYSQWANARSSKSRIQPKGRVANNKYSRKRQRGGQTQTRKDFEAKVVRQTSTQGISNSRKALIYKKKPSAKLYQQMSNVTYYESLDPGSMATGVAGSYKLQVVKYVCSYFSGSDVNVLQQKMFTNLKLANPLSATGSYAGANQYGMKIFLESLNSEIEMVNQSDCVTTVYLYNLLAKTSSTLTDPTTDWQTGLTNIQGANTESNTLPGTRPTMSKTFNMRWKVLGVQTLELLPGKVHKHKYTFKPNAIIDYEYFQTNTMVKGITNAVMMVGKGTPIDDNLTFAAPANITLSPVKVIYTLRNTYKTRMVLSLPKSGIQSNSLYAATTANTLYTFNDIRGTAESVTTNVA